MPTTIGVFGLGAMGFPMARRLCQAGYSVACTIHRNAEPVRALERLGATVYGSAADVARHSDIILSILPADAEMESVLLKPDVLDCVRPGTVLLEMTSGSPSMMKRVADAYTAKDARVLDAPVSGGIAGAENGTLTIMAAGEKALLDELHSVLTCLGQKICYVGEMGAGKAVKAINQMLAGIHMIATAEATSLIQQLQLDPNVVREVISASSGNSWMFQQKFDTVLSSSFEPGFKLNLMKKDVGIALKEGTNVALPLANLAYQLYQLASAEFGNQDFSAVSQLGRKAMSDGI